MTRENGMAHSIRNEARLAAAWRDFHASADALSAEPKAVPPQARRKAPRSPNR